MEFNFIKKRIEQGFSEKMDLLKKAYSKDKNATIFIRPGKDDQKGRCLMINFVVGSSFWLSPNSVNVTLWQDDEEYALKDQVVETLTSLAKENGFSNLKVQEKD